MASSSASSSILSSQFNPLTNQRISFIQRTGPTQSATTDLQPEVSTHSQPKSTSSSSSYNGNHHPLRLDVIDLSPLSITIRCSRRPLPISSLSIPTRTSSTSIRPSISQSQTHSRRSSAQDESDQEANQEEDASWPSELSDDETAVDPEENLPVYDLTSVNHAIPLFPFGLTILVNNQPWSRVVVAEKGEDEAIIVVFGLGDVKSQINKQLGENGTSNSDSRRRTSANGNGNGNGNLEGVASTSRIEEGHTSIGGSISGGKTIPIGTTGIKTDGIHCEIVLEVRSKEDHDAGNERESQGEEVEGECHNPFLSSPDQIVFRTEYL